MQTWEKLIAECKNCTKCGLCKNRKNVVFGDGNINAEVMFIGEAPGADEDALATPFVGRAGQLLNQALKALRINREECYIANICKCRPENNRVPYEQEALACLPYLEQQISFIMPKIIVCMGATPLKYLVDKNAQITKTRGIWIEKEDHKIMPTYHPAALLRDESKKVDFWEDLKKVREEIKG